MAFKGLNIAKKDLLKELFDVFEKAYVDQCSGGGDTEAYMKKLFEEMAKKYADTLSKGMADAICKFVLELKIDATVSGTIMAPSGPCTGTIPFSGFKVS